MRGRRHDLPYGWSSPRRSKPPGRLAKCPASPQRDDPSSDFKAAAGTAETRLSFLPLGMPSSLRTRSATFAIHSM